MTEVATVFKFADLNDVAKETARDELRSEGQYDGWYDNVYEDAVTVGALMGIGIEQKLRDSKNGYKLCETSIYFSGFSSQGDGACFEGRYAYKPDAVAAVTAYCGATDKELIRIATELSMLQLTRKLIGFVPFDSTVVTRGYYSHSGTMELSDCATEETDDRADLEMDHQDEFLKLLRDFADWIYKRLEDEDDYLTSDAHIDERLCDEEFDEDGNIV